MTSSFNEWVGVASSGESWDIGLYRLWKSTDPQTILYAAREPVLAQAAEPRFAASVTQTRRWQEGSYVAVGGSAQLSLSLFPLLDEVALQKLQEEWRRVVVNSGYTGTPDPKFLPLPTRDREFRVVLDPEVGASEAAPTIGESVAVTLTARGADEWGRALTDRTTVHGSLRCSYRYLRMLPEASGTVTVHGTRAFTHLSHALRPTADGSAAGTADEIRSAWESMLRSGAIEVTLAGSLPPGAEARRSEIVETFVRMAGEQLFESLFAPAPAMANGTGAVYTLRWRKLTDAIDLYLKLRVEGWSWVLASSESPLSTLLAPLDATYLGTTYSEVSVPVSLVVEGDPMLGGVAVSLVFSDGHVPEAPTFGPSGGTASYVVSTAHPDQVTVRYLAKLDFKPPHWPVVEQTGSISLSGSGGRIVIRPAEWVRRHTVYLYVRDGNRILPPGKGDPADYLALTASIDAPYLPAPIRQAARVTTSAAVELSYPRPPGSAPANTRLTALGMVGGQMVRSPSLAVQESDESIFLLAGKGEVGLYHRNSVVTESGHPAGRLVAAGARAIIVQTDRPPMAEDWRDVDFPVELVPQPTGVTCWAASLTMVISHRDQASYAVSTVASAAGMDTTTGYGWSSIRAAVQTWDLVEEGPVSAPPEEWANMLRAWGPIWIVEIGAPYHAVVVGGISGDGTPEGTIVTLYNPWPPNVGAIERKAFLDFDQEYGLGAGAGAALVHAR